VGDLCAPSNALCFQLVLLVVSMQVMVPFEVTLLCHGKHLWPGKKWWVIAWFLLRALDVSVAVVGIVVWFYAKDMFGGTSIAPNSAAPSEYKFIWVQTMVVNSVSLKIAWMLVDSQFPVVLKDSIVSG
jgi:hypothetical protein